MGASCARPGVGQAGWSTSRDHDTGASFTATHGGLGACAAVDNRRGQAEGVSWAVGRAAGRRSVKGSNVASRLRVDGKRVWCTGAGAGIGLVDIARTFMEAGARVHICDLSRDVLDATLAANPGLTGSIADVGVEADVDALFADVEADLGGLDVLINNAGNAGPTANVDVSLPDWNRTWDVCIGHVPVHPPRRAHAEGRRLRLDRQPVVRGRPASASRCAAVCRRQVGGRRLHQVDQHGAGPLRHQRERDPDPGLVAGDRPEQRHRRQGRREGHHARQQRADLLRHVSMQRMVARQEIADMALYLSSYPGHGVSGQAISSMHQPDRADLVDGIGPHDHILTKDSASGSLLSGAPYLLKLVRQSLGRFRGGSTRTTIGAAKSTPARLRHPVQVRAIDEQPRDRSRRCAIDNISILRVVHLPWTIKVPIWAHHPVRKIPWPLEWQCKPLVRTCAPPSQSTERVERVAGLLIPDDARN